MTAYECFKLAEQIELLSQDLYTRLAAHPGTPGPIQKEFLALADEEGRHASRIRLLASTSRGSPALQDVARRAGEGLVAVAAELKAALEQAAHRRPGDLVVVLDRLITLEQRFSWVHAEALAGCADPKVAALFTSMARQDARHTALLAKARQEQPGA